MPAPVRQEKFARQARAQEVLRSHTFPVIQLDPYRVSLPKMAHGYYDGYLEQQARLVEAFHCPIAISFGHEMNGGWAVWGLHHVSPQTFIAAWRHVHDVFVQAGATNVVWLWTTNVYVLPTVSPAKEWWPGGKYVNWVAIDGYLRRPQSTFHRVFAKTLRDVHGLTHDPVMLAETSVTRNGSQAQQIQDLFSGATRANIFAIVWFDLNAQEPWRLEGRPAAVLKAFHRAAALYIRPIRRGVASWAGGTTLSGTLSTAPNAAAR